MDENPESGPQTPAPQPAKKRRSRRIAPIGEGVVADLPVPAAPAADNGAHPPAVVSGRPNPDHYRSRLSAVNRLMETAISDHDRIPFNYEAAIKGIMFEAKMAGIGEEELSDRRSAGDKLADALDRYLQSPESIWEDTDAELVGVAAAMDKADELVREHLAGRIRNIVDRSAAVKKLQSLGRRIRTVLDLRLRARLELSKHPGDKHEVWGHAIKAAHILRFMLYVGRSNIPSDEPGGTVYRISHHHATMAWAIYEARNGMYVGCEDEHHNYKPVLLAGKIPYLGVILVAPPGHSKTELACHFTVREICFAPETQAVMLHAVAEKAEGNLRYVAACFDRGNAVGRRCMALFPVELASSTSKKMRVKLKRPMNQATLEAYGVMAGRLGVNTTLQVWDDIVPQSDVNEEATRERRFDRVAGTWMTRRRGSKAFILCIGTLWHHWDTLSRLISLASKKNDPVMFRVSRQKCGGPKDTPQFYPLCPELYNQQYLRQQFQILGPHIYSAAYESNPRSESARIVRRLRFYDPMTEEHAEFRKRAVNYLSLDPSGVNRAGNDKSALVYAAAGELAVVSPDGESYEAREVLRIIEAREFNASQTDLVEYTRGYALNNSTHYVLAEQQGQAAIVDIFREFYGVDVIPMIPGNKNKEVRLRRVGGMLDESQTEVGGPQAVVEFPGVVVARTPQGRPILGPDPNLKWLYDQILDFGVATGDHALDAVTQLCFHLLPQLRPGAGTVTEQVQRRVVLSSDGQAKKLAMEQHDRDRNRSAAEEDAAWYADQNRNY